MGARWVDPALSRWLSADTVVPDSNNPQSFNRYSWVRNNPLKFIDPSGFCEGTADNHPASEDACWNWIAQIQATYSNIWVDPAVWIAEELAIVYYSLGAHVFRNDILKATHITLHRRHDLILEGGIKIGTVAGTHQKIGDTHEVTLYDYAYHLTPDANERQEKESSLNFQGTVIHELTHVAIAENPLILESYQKSKRFQWQPPVGARYPYVDIGCTSTTCRDTERIAMTASAYHLTPDVFKWKFLVEGTYWQLDWIRQFDSPPGPGEVSIHAP